MEPARREGPCTEHSELMREHGELQGQIKTLTRLVEKLLGRYPRIVTYIIALLSSLLTLFATLYFAQGSRVNEVYGKQQMVVIQLTDLNKSMTIVQEQTIRNASALAELKDRLVQRKTP